MEKTIKTVKTILFREKKRKIIKRHIEAERERILKMYGLYGLFLSFWRIQHRLQENQDYRASNLWSFYSPEYYEKEKKDEKK